MKFNFASMVEAVLMWWMTKRGGPTKDQALKGRHAVGALGELGFVR